MLETVAANVVGAGSGVDERAGSTRGGSATARQAPARAAERTRVHGVLAVPRPKQAGAASSGAPERGRHP